MLTLDTITGLLAPHQCIACGQEGSVLCETCLLSAGEPMAPRCAGCKTLSADWKTCRNCRAWLKAERVYVATVYEGLYEQMVRALKFDMQRPAVQPMAAIMAALTAEISEFVVCPVPTASARIRERGFDHTRLLAKAFANQTGLPCRFLLARKSNVRQLGSSRSKRIQQMAEEFYVRKPEMVKGRGCLLVDDVMTTGATVAAAAATLKAAGARSVRAVVFAQKA